MLTQQSTEMHKGKMIDCFEDEHGNELKNLYMKEYIVIKFTDGSSIRLSNDWRGSECYISQYKE